MNFKFNNIDKRTLIYRLQFTNKFSVLQVFSQKNNQILHHLYNYNKRISHTPTALL